MLTQPANRCRSTWISHPHVLFGLAVVLPGLLVGAVGWRTIDADRREALPQFDDRLDNAAERALTEWALTEWALTEWALTEWDGELRRWDTALIGLDAVIADSPPLSPTAIGAAVRSDLAVVVRFDGERVSVEPPDRVLYDPDDAAVLDAGTPPPAALAAAERVEFGGDHAGAARKYQQRLQRATRASRPALLLRLARTFQKGGRVDDALAQDQGWR